MGTLRSLGALARALGPMVAASGEGCGRHGTWGTPGRCSPPQLPAPASWAAALRPTAPAGPGLGVGAHVPARCLSAVYWLAGAPACFTVCAGLFLLPFLLLRDLQPPARTLKAE